MSRANAFDLNGKCVYTIFNLLYSPVALLHRPTNDDNHATNTHLFSTILDVYILYALMLFTLSKMRPLMGAVVATVATADRFFSIHLLW